MLRLAARTGETPELMIGSGFVLGGGIGYPATIASLLWATASPEWALRSAIAAQVALHVCTWIMMVAWYSIYHRGHVGARAGVVALTVGLFVILVDRLAETTPESLTGPALASPSGYVSLTSQVVPYLFMAISGFRYHAQLRRRLPLGLADPVVADRIRLWSWVSLLVVAQYSWSLATLHLMGQATVATASRVVVGSLGLALAALLTLAFFPPPRYLRRVRDRAAATVSGAGI